MEISSTKKTMQNRENDVLYIIIGSYYLSEDSNFAITNFYKKSVAISNLVFEGKLLTGFDALNLDYIFLSAPIVGKWPFLSKKLVVKGFHGDERIHPVSYLTPYGLCNFFKGLAIKREIRKIKKTFPKNKRVHVIACESHKPYLLGVKKVKKLFKSSFSTLIVPDLTENMDYYHSSFLYKFFKKRNAAEISALTKNYIDSFFCLNEEINKKINPSNKPSIIFPCIYTPIDKESFELEKTDGKIHCGFFGKTDKRNGIEIIVEAAKIAPKNIVFDIYGSGDDDEYLSTLKLDNLIVHGFVSPNEAFKTMHNIDIFLSPRLPGEEYTKYSFPSKICDYMSFYKPIITYKLDCYPKELDNLFIYPKDMSPESLLESIDKCCSMDKDYHSAYKVFLDKVNSVNVVSSLKSLNEK